MLAARSFGLVRWPYPLVPNTIANISRRKSRLQSAYAIAPEIVNMTALLRLQPTSATVVLSDDS
jgi:hypothetical protein